jgi:hypothetical protein
VGILKFVHLLNDEKDKIKTKLVVSISGNMDETTIFFGSKINREVVERKKNPSTFF